jgi:hypothetical protein
MTKHLPGPPMTLGNMRALGMQRLVAYCLNPPCRHEGLIDVSKYKDEVEVRWFRLRAKCGNCGTRNVDVRPNWKEQSTGGSLTARCGADGIWPDCDRYHMVVT